MDIAGDSEKLDALFTALAHSKRRGIVHYLSFRPATVSQLAQEYDLSLPAIHKHLRVLKQAGLVRTKKSGRTNYVALNKQSLGQAKDWLTQYHTHWGNDKESLENYIAALKD